MKPKLAFVSLWNAADRNAESGYAYSMRRQLAKRFEIVDVFPLALPGERFFLPLRAAYKTVGRYYHPMREPSVLKALGRQIEAKLKTIAPQVAFAPSSIPMSFVDSRVPWAYSTDQLFCDFLGTYIPNPSRRYRRQGEAQEARALERAARASYPSQWAARSAIDHYGASEAKIDVIPWGGNLPEEILEADVQAAIAARRPDRCRLIFLGRDWLRKGGPSLVATMAELERRGLSAHATIVGCAPADLSAGTFTVHPFLDKGRPEHFATLKAALLESHFLFLPSRAEAYGQAFCEAAAFGVPSIGSTAGGIPTIIRHGVTGFTPAPDASAADYADLIEETLGAPERYARMAAEARQDYLDRLNWDRFGDRLCESVAALV